MQKMIERFVESSLKGDLFDKAIECMKELRYASVREDEAQSFNKFAEKMKLSVLKDVDKEEFFKKMSAEKLTLITKHESVDSTVEQDEANQFMEYTIK